MWEAISTYCEGYVRPAESGLSFPEATPREQKKLARGDIIGRIPDLLRILEKFILAHLSL